MTTREKAIAICERAAQSAEASARDYAEHAKELGFDVDYVVGTDGWPTMPSGADFEAVEMAALAWLDAGASYKINDPRRDLEAAAILREGIQ